MSSSNEKIYCLKCKRFTPTKFLKEEVTKNGRRVLKGTCSICKIKKNKFLSSQKGGSILNRMINNMPFEMHLPGHNFTGPGTNLKKRMPSAILNRTHTGDILYTLIRCRPCKLLRVKKQITRSL